MKRKPSKTKQPKPKAKKKTKRALVDDEADASGADTSNAEEDVETPSDIAFIDDEAEEEEPEEETQPVSDEEVEEVALVRRSPVTAKPSQPKHLEVLAPTPIRKKSKPAAAASSSSLPSPRVAPATSLQTSGPPVKYFQPEGK
jgi:hypothetical protein